MRRKLEPRWTEQLLKLSESGMGYQRVEVRFTDGRKLTNTLVFNAEEMEVPDEFAHAKIENIDLHASAAR